ncbi:outer membrane protein [Pseudovibrio exalbescens]|uniref:outer membrane protein n=1 Tax=Pseudovibrio exalbescens TaxID=197461 RepID=UPI000412320C|nr:outer membrane protein [Pseudovibrio exalbescens]
MKSIVRVVSFACAAAAASAVWAADLPEPVIEHVPVVPEASNSGWYLRGDIGYKVYTQPDAGFAHVGFYDEDMDPTGVVGVGAGYRFNDYLRTDVTLDYEWDSDFYANAACISSCVGSSAASDEYATLDVWTVLWNVYADLGQYNGFSPYVGAGIGASYVNVDSVKAINDGGARVAYPGGSNWNFSWALMAGVGYSISPHWHIDAGYRYLNIGDAKTKKFTDAGATDSIEYRDLSAHEFRVGMRYEFGPSYADYTPGPVVSKY